MNVENHEASTSMANSLTPEEKDAAALTLKSLERFDAELLDETKMWIFGYGSLVWLQGFAFEKSLTGFIKGYARKFWQGNTAHRGTEEKPGRVVTLVEEEDAIVWGQAFQVKEKDSFSYLNNRECELGGYITTITNFFPRQDNMEDKWIKPFPVILYIATPSNDLWLGDSPLPDIAHQIVECRGNSGYNVEYLLKLAAFIHEKIPEAEDDHLFTLERLVMSEIKQRKLCLKTLMGEMKPGKEESVAVDNREREQDLDGGERGRTDAQSQFTSTVPSKTLRCVNI